MNYEVVNVCIEIDGEFVPFELKVANEEITLKDGTVVRGVCIVKRNGKDAKPRYWTQDKLDTAIELADSTDIESLQATFSS